jgi:hypothetical protein
MAISNAILAALLLAAAGQAAAVDTPQAERRVVEIYPGASVYTRDGDRFAKAGDAGSAVVLPAVVREESPRGYVRVDGTTGPVWLDALDVEVVPPRTARNADCRMQVSGNPSMQVAASRAAGEGCSQ